MFKTASGVGVRQPALAGKFYPANLEELRTNVRDYLDYPGSLQGAESNSESDETGVLKAIIVPHAGYRYSGPIAASAYRRVHEYRDTIKRVVLIGPAHYVSFQGVVTCSYGSFDTPLGQVPLDLDGIRLALEKTSVWVYNEPHAPEHCLEVQLPFLQEILDGFSLVPLLVGQTSAGEVATVLETLWDGPETLIVISSDLSHYLNYDEASQLDRATSGAIERLAPGDIGENQACGRLAIQGLLDRAVAHNLKAHTVDLRNSADTGGGPAMRDRVVGYGAYIFIG